MDPVRLIFDANTGPAIGASMMDMGQRFRMVANVVDVVPTDAPLPKLPVARALWLPRPNLKVAAAAWIYAGGRTIPASAMPSPPSTCGILPPWPGSNSC